MIFKKQHADKQNVSVLNGLATRGECPGIACILGGCMHLKREARHRLGELGRSHRGGTGQVGVHGDHHQA